MIGLENSHQPLSQSVAKINPIATWSHAFPRASCNLLVIASSYHRYFSFFRISCLVSPNRSSLCAMRKLGLGSPDREELWASKRVRLNLLREKIVGKLHVPPYRGELAGYILQLIVYFGLPMVVKD